MYSPKTSPWHGALHKWILDIDGNVNSWGFLWKLLSGCCVLKVESDHIQWYYHLLKPMIHYIPVKNDLSDLIEKVIWCKKNNNFCESIASNGKFIAKNVIQEMDKDISSSIDSYGEKYLYKIKQ